MKRVLSKKEKGEINILECLYIISIAQELREAWRNEGKPYPYLYLDGREMSTRDILRIEGMKIRELDVPLKSWNTNYILRKAEEEEKYIRTEFVYPVTNFEREVKYLTNKGTKHLSENKDSLISVYPKIEEIVGDFPQELKEKVTLNRLSLI